MEAAPRLPPSSDLVLCGFAVSGWSGRRPGEWCRRCPATSQLTRLQGDPPLPRHVVGDSVAHWPSRNSKHNADKDCQPFAPLHPYPLSARGVLAVSRKPGVRRAAAMSVCQSCQRLPAKALPTNPPAPAQYAYRTQEAMLHQDVGEQRRCVGWDGLKFALVPGHNSVFTYSLLTIRAFDVKDS